MVNNSYSRAYTEVLEIISHFPDEEYAKIPKEKIDFYKTNMDKTYEYHINPEIDLDEQNISNEANAILITLFRDYFATEKQKETLVNLLDQNQKKIEKERREKYNPDNMFKTKETPTQNEKIVQETALVEYKESIFTIIKNWIKSLFGRK